MILLDLFAGIGGFHLGLKRAGFEFKKTYFSEIDKHAIAIYKNQFKGSEYVGSVTDVSKWGIERPNIITFGSPCQDFSIAGKRGGLGGSKSSLFSYAIDAIKKFQPDCFIWENVKGSYSSNRGRDFQAIMQEFANLGNYRIEWQLLNTSWLLPQNRERIYLVGHLAGRSKPGVFPFRESDFWVNERSIKTPSVRCLTAGGNSGGLHSSMTLIKPVLTPGRKEKRQNGRRFKNENEPMFTLTAQDKHGVMFQSPRGYNKGGLKNICPTLTDENFHYNNGVIQLNENKESGGAQPYQQNRVYDINGISPAIDLDHRKNIQIKSNLKGKDYELLEEGDSVNYQNQGSKTRKGRIGKGKAQTLDTACSIGVLEGTQIRRLTEIECERLQGFPQIELSINFKKCLDRQKSYVYVGKKNLKLQKHVSNAGKEELKVSAKYVKKYLNLRNQQINRPARKSVHISFGEEGVQILNQGKLLLTVKNAGKQKKFPLVILTEHFVLLLVRMSLIQDQIILNGKEVLHQKELRSILQKNLKMQENLFGKEMTQPVRDARTDLITLKKLLKYTTLSHLNTKNSESIMIIWFCFVMDVIIGFIPKGIKINSLSDLSISINHGWTKFGLYEKGLKEVSKTQRYKSLGNAVTVDIVEMIGSRLLNNCMIK